MLYLSATILPFFFFFYLLNFYFFRYSVCHFCLLILSYFLYIDVVSPLIEMKKHKQIYIYIYLSDSKMDYFRFAMTPMHFCRSFIIWTPRPCRLDRQSKCSCRLWQMNSLLSLSEHQLLRIWAETGNETMILKIIRAQKMETFS